MYDIAYERYKDLDLISNRNEATLGVWVAVYRSMRGGGYNNFYKSFYRGYVGPTSGIAGTRLSLYIN